MNKWTSLAASSAAHTLAPGKYECEWMLRQCIIDLFHRTNDRRLLAPLGERTGEPYGLTAQDGEG